MFCRLEKISLLTVGWTVPLALCQLWKQHITVPFYLFTDKKNEYKLNLMFFSSFYSDNVYYGLKKNGFNSNINNAS